MAYRKWKDEDLINAVKTSRNIREVFGKLGFKTDATGNYKNLERHIKRLDIDISHFSRWHMPESYCKSIPLEQLLVKNSMVSGYFKKRIIKAGLLKEICYICNIDTWHNKKLTLQLDHTNGDRNDNRIENLRLLCPNCHSLTSTFCRGKRNKESKDNKCIDCENGICDNSTRCKKCEDINRESQTKIAWPNNLSELVQQKSLTVLGKELGISDAAIRKRCVKFGIELPVRRRKIILP